MAKPTILEPRIDDDFTRDIKLNELDHLQASPTLHSALTEQAQITRTTRITDAGRDVECCRVGFAREITTKPSAARDSHNPTLTLTTVPILIHVVRCSWKKLVYLKTSP
jgi:hypothetical protein